MALLANFNDPNVFPASLERSASQLFVFYIDGRTAEAAPANMS